MISGPSVDRHHLVPKLKGGGRDGGDLVHRVCHGKIHSRWCERELRDDFNTWDAINSDPEIRKFVVWVKKKPPEFKTSSRAVNGHERRRWR